jgi:hypothetical protein
VAARFDSFSEGPQRNIAGDAAVPFANHVAVPGMDGDGRGVPVEAVFEYPVGLRGPGLLTLPLLLLAAFDCRDLLPHLGEL